MRIFIPTQLNFVKLLEIGIKDGYNPTLCLLSIRNIEKLVLSWNGKISDEYMFNISNNLCDGHPFKINKVDKFITNKFLPLQTFPFKIHSFTINLDYFDYLSVNISSKIISLFLNDIIELKLKIHKKRISSDTICKIRWLIDIIICRLYINRYSTLEIINKSKTYIFQNTRIGVENLMRNICSYTYSTKFFNECLEKKIYRLQTNISTTKQKVYKYINYSKLQTSKY